MVLALTKFCPVDVVVVNKGVKFVAVKCAAITWNSNDPTGVFIGRTVLTVICLNPGALLLKISEFLTPGPHQMFSFDNPTDIGLKVSLMLLCPKNALL